MFRKKITKIILVIFMILFLSACQKDNNKFFVNMSRKIIRHPAVAGTFYPASADKLKKDINKYLSEAPLGVRKEIKAVIVPHAGYIYSGLVAAAAYKQIQGQNVETIFLLANAHTRYFNGIAVDNSDYWQTPLGKIEVDINKAKQLVMTSDRIIFNPEAHLKDHTLEVQLPFLQVSLPSGFKIVPILFGADSGDNYEILTAALYNIMNKEDLIIVSSDLSHYPAYDIAEKIDNKTLSLIVDGNISGMLTHIKKTMAMNIPGEETLACGLDGIKTLMRLAQKKSWQGKIIKYQNSGDIAGDKERVVGYGAVIYFANKRKRGELTGKLTNKQQEILLNIAEKTIENFVLKKDLPQFDIKDARLWEKEGAFVTINMNGRLRGCIGQIISEDKPLWQVVRDMAIAACSEDPRFPPVNNDELNKLEYEVSVLSRPQIINDWQKIKLGEHGVIVRKGFRSGVFLPQVATETGWSLEEFLSQLCAQKAGLPADCYKNDPDIILEIFTAQVFSKKK